MVTKVSQNRKKIPIKFNMRGGGGGMRRREEEEEGEEGEKEEEEEETLPVGINESLYRRR